MCFEKEKHCRIHLTPRYNKQHVLLPHNVPVSVLWRFCCGCASAASSISTSSLSCACGLVRSSSRLLLRGSTQGAADGAVIQVSASMARPGRSGEALDEVDSSASAPLCSGGCSRGGAHRMGSLRHNDIPLPSLARETWRFFLEARVGNPPFLKNPGACNVNV